MIKKLLKKLICKLYGHEYVVGNKEKLASELGFIYSYCDGIKDKIIKIPYCKKCDREVGKDEMIMLNIKFIGQ